MEVNYFQVPRQFYSKSSQNSGYKTVKTVLKYTRKTFKNPGNPEGQSRVCGIEKSRENPGFPVPGKPGEKPYHRHNTTAARRNFTWKKVHVPAANHIKILVFVLLYE